MRVAMIDRRSQSREVIDTFLGLNKNMKIRKDEFNDMLNMTSLHYPLLANRPKRGQVSTLTKPGGMIEKDALCYVANGSLYVNGTETGLTGLADGEKQLVGMGAYICVFPDKKYYNTEDATDCGSMEASYSSGAGSTVDYYPCDAEGTVYTNITASTTEPTNPANGALWADTSGNTTVLMQYSSTQAMWVSIPTVYTKIVFRTTGSIPALFKQYDGVKISGCSALSDLNGDKILYGLGGSGATGATAEDYIIVVGLITAASEAQQDTVTITRTLPDMDYVCECQNRLWGCYYGLSGGKIINEIYCCALGDFKNWRQYMGLATDSWTASVGSDGQWTGAANYLGHPCFFKEERIHAVSVSSEGAHQIQETVCRGVQKGSWKSLVVVDETLFYKSRTDICAWQGGFPVNVSIALGDEEKYSSAAAGCFRGKYYISMKDSANHWHLLVYDTRTKLWHREDDLHAICFCRVDDELYCIESGTNKLWALMGSAGTKESSVSWMAESGILYYEYANRKYLSRFTVKVWLAEGASMKVWIQYDSDGVWKDVGTVTRKGMGTTLLPVKPRRCDHLKIKFTGTGDAKVFSVTRILEVGSDYK